MSGCSTSMNSEVQDLHIKNTPPPYANSSGSLLEHGVYNVKMMKDDGMENWNADGEDEDEDVDFNPFLKETLSSSLSSVVEDLDTDGDDTVGDPSLAFSRNLKETHLNTENGHCTTKDVECGGNILNQTSVSSRECGGISEINCVPFSERGMVLESQDGLLQDKENRLTGLTEICGAIDSRKAIVNMDTNGAIGMRTRARCSLTSFTLDELETFLQESDDDDDDLQNIDEQEEYRKFLSSVLQVDDSLNLQSNADGDDEEDDADFELELQQALESDHDEIEERCMSSRKRCRKPSFVPNRKKSCQSNRSLPPILPFVQMGSFSTFDKNQTTETTVSSYNPPPYNGCTTGFSPDQIGQLHCLIHEHVQLLIQVFSVCAFDLAKSDITTQIKDLILELLQKRDQALGWRTHPFPSFCFFPPYTHPSVAEEPHPHIISSPDGKESHQSDEDLGGFTAHECAAWVPYICGPLLSITDVAPLRLVQSFIDDVSSAVLARRINQVELGLDFGSGFEKEPLFSFHKSPVSVERDSQRESVNTPGNSNEVLSPSSIYQISTKTIAADLIKKSKKQPVASVPKEIAIMAQRFCQMFNPALYPRNPPPATLANRVLFTDAEDELLALGIMEYNTDWKAIQQRFLPCKSSHQIFVRQKNRTTSKAPENPIKEVRRLKNSPLTPEEIAKIEVGLKIYNLDWISIWRLYVPHRDPSLLPRQWRIACGTQRSYKADENKKAMRRLHDFRRRKPNQSSFSDREGYSIDNAVDDPNNGDILMDGVDKAYVHETFLGDSNPNTNGSLMSPTPPYTSNVGLPQMWVRGPTSAKLPDPSIVHRPYHTRNRRNKHVNLVKLAPGLPPITLPPSVRVVPQSGFVKSAEITTGDQRKMDCEVERVNANFQMHPLLFEAPQITNTLTFFPEKRPCINLNLLQNPRQTRDSVNILSKSSDIHFHPLLHVDTSSIHSAAKFLSDPRDSNFNMTSGTEISNNVTNPSKNKGSVSNGLDSCELPTVTSRYVGSKDVADNMQTGSLPGNIMEHEELSDSGNEEIENDVEFEHEEITDSDLEFEHEEMTDSDVEFEHEEMTDSDVEFEHEEIVDSGDDEEMQRDKMRVDCVVNMKKNCEGRNSSRYNLRSKPPKRTCG